MPCRPFVFNFRIIWCVCMPAARYICNHHHHHHHHHQPPLALPLFAGSLCYSVAHLTHTHQLNRSKKQTTKTKPNLHKVPDRETPALAAAAGQQATEPTTEANGAPSTLHAPLFLGEGQLFCMYEVHRSIPLFLPLTYSAFGVLPTLCMYHSFIALLSNLLLNQIHHPQILFCVRVISKNTLRNQMATAPQSRQKCSETINQLSKEKKQKNNPIIIDMY
ncbi:hypothetical protein QBC41DRAFT_61659 [Cercophora samala]|uniref:Uncharacterized protein n=1 Tax=Cercophora samala TaxID=330535 RepID=A0AA39ZHF0_9PEZI|nr:hypothetical protein QBC41DRAFT_61659 [Cercophora samala]